MEGKAGDAGSLNPAQKAEQGIGYALTELPLPSPARVKFKLTTMWRSRSDFPGCHTRFFGGQCGGKHPKRAPKFNPGTLRPPPPHTHHRRCEYMNTMDFITKRVLKGTVDFKER